MERRLAVIIPLIGLWTVNSALTQTTNTTISIGNTIFDLSETKSAADASNLVFTIANLLENQAQIQEWTPYAEYLQNHMENYIDDLLHQYSSTTNAFTKLAVLRVFPLDRDTPGQEYLIKHLEHDLKTILDSDIEESWIDKALLLMTVHHQIPIVRFEQLEEIQIYIQNHLETPKDGFGKELIRAQSILKKMDKIQKNYPFSRITLRESHITLLLAIVNQAAIHLESQNLPSKEKIIDHLLSKYISPEGSILDYAYYDYLREHARDYQNELLAAFDEESNIERKEMIIDVFWDYKLNPELEAALIERLKKDRDTAAGNEILSLLLWAGGADSKIFSLKSSKMGHPLSSKPHNNAWRYGTT
ncbi:MAG: hypothetical protein JXR40_02875 [Pontiellaceae bacterium]|nr:hypothetical protein [Pontiellaceae bacterium]